MKKLIFIVLGFLFIACPSTQKNAAKIYLGQGQYDKAKEQLLLGIEQSPGDFEYYALLAKAEIGLTNWVGAGKAFQDAFKIDSINTMNWILKDKINIDVYWQTFYNAALALFAEKKYEDALTKLRYAQLINPSDVKQYILEGAIYSEMGKTEMANKAYTKALNIDPENPEAYYFIGKALFNNKSYDSSSVYFNSAIKYFEIKNERIRKVIFQNIPTHNAELEYEIIKLWMDKKFDELNQLVKTKLGFDGGLDAHKQNIELFFKTTDVTAQSYYWLGMAYYKLNKDSLALKNFNKTLELMPSDLNALFFTGEVLIKLTKYPEAIGYFEKVVQLKPDDRDAWWYLGALNLRLKDYKKAIDIYENNVLRLDPKFIEALQNLASAYQALGNNKKAREIMVKVEQLKKEQKK